LFVNNEIYKPFQLNSRAQGVSGKINNLPKHHGAEPQEARGPMQLHRLKADPTGVPSTNLLENADSYRPTDEITRQKHLPDIYLIID